MSDDNSDDAKSDTRITGKAIAYIDAQMKESDELQRQQEIEEAAKKLPAGQLPAELDRLKKENEQLIKQQKEALLKQFNDEEQEEFKDRSITELQLLLDYKAKHLKRGIQRSQPTDASDKRTATKMTPGSIGSWDPIKREWK